MEARAEVWEAVAGRTERGGRRGARRGGLGREQPEFRERMNGAREQVAEPPTVLTANE